MTKLRESGDQAIRVSEYQGAGNQDFRISGACWQPDTLIA